MPFHEQKPICMQSDLLADPHSSIKPGWLVIQRQSDEANVVVAKMDSSYMKISVFLMETWNA